MRTHALKLVSLLSLAMAVALFVPQRAAADQDDPPGRVARLSYTHGSVSFNPAGTDDWVTAVVNRPITTGDKLWTDNRTFKVPSVMRICAVRSSRFKNEKPVLLEWRIAAEPMFSSARERLWAQSLSSVVTRRL